MSAIAPRRACCAVIVAGALVGLVGGCGDAGSRPASADQTHVEGDVRALLDRWARSFESRDLDTARSVLAGDDRFVWLEDGQVRYPSVDSVVAALASFPQEMGFSHTLDSIRVVPISPDAAWAQVATSTRIRHAERVVSEFQGVVLMLAERERGVWRIVAAHTSTTRPRTPTAR